MAGGILKVFVAPMRFVRRLLINVLQLADGSYALALPVAGLDEEAAHQILSTLRAAEHDGDDADLPTEWLSALELVQIASDRLIWDLSRVEKSLEFWSERLRQDQHLRTMLFGQGPVSFAKDVTRIVSRRQSAHSPSDRIERRVIVLRDLRAKLAESLAQVHAAASLLHLKAAKVRDSESGEDFDPQLLERIARQAIQDSCTSTAKAYQDIQVYAENKLQGLEHATSDLRQTALAQMFKLHSKRMFKFGSNGSALDLADQDDDQDETSKLSEGDERPASVASPAVEHLQQVLDVDVDIDSSTTAHNALSQANTIASVQRHVIDLPKWLKMPNKLTRQWVMYSFIGLGAGYIGVFLIRHSRLVGSKDLEQWGASAVRAVAEAYQQHILQPLLAVRNELFQTFRQKRSIVSSEDYEADKESLVRMLEDFRKDNNGTDATAESEPAIPETEVADLNMTPEELNRLRRDLDFMMTRYEGELKQPIRNVVTGKLPRTLLIQVQKLKVDLEAAMLQLDQILRANELSIALVAAIPAFIVGGLTIVGLFRWLTPTPPDPKWEALPCRMAMVEVERAVQALNDGKSAEEQGILIYRLAIVYKEAVTLFRRHKLDSNTPQSEWRNMRADLIQLAAPKSMESKSRIVKRMMRVYTIFRI